MKNAIEHYYGILIQLANGLRAQLEEEPDTLTTTRQIIALGMPLVDGGIQDQPFIWLLEFKLCLDAMNMFDKQLEAARELQRNPAR